MSSPPETWDNEDVSQTDPFVPVFTSHSRSRSLQQSSDLLGSPLTGEHAPLLNRPSRVKKPFYRPRPLWLVPFAVISALVRGMTLAPRIEVFTQLSCSRLHHSYNHTRAIDPPPPFVPPRGPLYFSGDPLGPQLVPSDNAPILAFVGEPTNNEPWDDTDTGGDDVRRLPSARCMADPAVQAGAARLQTIFTTTMGLLSAFTTSWWGHFGERHGRTRVLAFTTIGLLMTDLIFILSSTPSSPFSSHGHKLLLVAPIIEGLLGSASTLQSSTSAYISDCTSSGSRASVFSRFTGVSFLGFGLGPIIGGYLIRNPISFLDGPPHPGQVNTPSVTSVFWVAIALQFINLCLVALVFPESVSKEQRALAAGNHKGKGKARDNSTRLADVAEETEVESGFLTRLLSPLAVFMPVSITIPGTTRKRTDWSLTFVACAMFGYMLSTGLYQIKYLYAGHVYGWGAEPLSYYISLLGTTRAGFLLFVFPLIISTFKPKSDAPKDKAMSKAERPKPTKGQLAKEIRFDMGLSRLSLITDILANTAILVSPAPTYKMHSNLMNDLVPPSTGNSEFQKSQALFVFASWVQCMGAGIVPAIQSLALCIVQARSLLASESGQLQTKDAGAGALFGALAVLQASGQMVLGPLLFGLVYSGTVSAFPKTVFVLSIGILITSFIAILLVRNPLSNANGKGAMRKRRRISASQEQEESTRGRSRVSKDLGYGSTMQRPPALGEPSSSGRLGSNPKIDPNQLSPGSLVIMNSADPSAEPFITTREAFLNAIPDSGPLVRPCGNCQNVPPKGKEFSKCAKCGGTYYCSRECQIAHWKEHKATCKHRVGMNAKFAQAKEAALAAGEKYFHPATLQSWYRINHAAIEYAGFYALEHHKGFVQSLIRTHVALFLVRVDENATEDPRAVRLEKVVPILLTELAAMLRMTESNLAQCKRAARMGQMALFFMDMKANLQVLEFHEPPSPEPYLNGTKPLDPFWEIHVMLKVNGGLPAEEEEKTETDATAEMPAVEAQLEPEKPAETDPASK
ncbi:unnamed protein product [Mycena citricolor]|uniref:MYND-type domain-containing protein n=1 Tax=Mycena citricolor TaxID=2018698 RepID=A0AAD2JYM5_9AGAR|nr:unnamed protein product [Mycena citricolor]